MLFINSNPSFTAPNLWKPPVFLGLAFFVSCYTTPFFAKHFKKNDPLILLGQILNLVTICSLSKWGCRFLGLPLSFFQIFKIFLFSSILFLSYRVIAETCLSKKRLRLQLF